MKATNDRTGGSGCDITWSNIANTLLVALWALFLVAALPLGLREDMEDIADDDNDLSLLSSFVANL